MKKFLIKHRIVKNEKQANALLLLVVILCFIFIARNLFINTASRSLERDVDSYEFTEDDPALLEPSSSAL